MGRAWTQLTTDNADSIVANTAHAYMLITLANSGDMQIYAPGTTLRTLSTTAVTLTSPVWVWNGEIQYLDGSNEIQTIVPDEPTCKRYIDYDGETEFYLDKDNQIS